MHLIGQESSGYENLAPIKAGPPGEECETLEDLHNYVSKRQNAAQEFNVLEAEIEEYYKDRYEGDPHFVCISALQELFIKNKWMENPKGRKDEKDERDDMKMRVQEEWYHKYLKVLFAALNVFLGTIIQLGLLIGVGSEHFWADADKEISTRFFLFVCGCASLAFVAQASTEFRECWDMNVVILTGNLQCRLACWVLVLLPKFAFAFAFNFCAPLLFLDATQKTDIILNCTGLLFMLQVDNDFFKAYGGKLHEQDLKALVSRVRHENYPVSKAYMDPKTENKKLQYAKEHECSRIWRTVLSTCLSTGIAFSGFCWFKYFVFQKKVSQGN